MGRKKKDDSGEAGCGCVLLVVFITVTFVSVVLATPIVMFFGYIRNKVLASRAKKSIKTSISAYWLTEEEKQTFKNVVAKKSDRWRKLASEKQRGIDAGISTNKDGSFSARSNLGKELQGSIAELESDIDRLFDIQYSLSREPRYRWSAAHNNYHPYASKAAGYKWGLIGWILIALIYNDAGAGIAAKQIVQSYWSLATYFFEDIPKIDLTEPHLWALGIVTGSSLALYYIRKKISFRPYQGCPEPDLVTIENVDEF